MAQAARVNTIKANGDDDTLRNESTATVFVGCKLLHGIICELSKGTSEHRHVKLRGSRTGRLMGFGVTRVPKDFIERWLKENRTLDFVRSTPNKPASIWVADTEENCVAMGLGLRGMVTGFEALDGEKIPKDVEVDVEHLKKLGVSVKGVSL